MKSFNRRFFLAAGAANLVVLTAPAVAAVPLFYRSPGCGCCHVWTERMATAGLSVELLDTEDLGGISTKLGIPANLQGCHVGEIGGYIVSGHVPPEDIKRLLREKPEARGLLVPGMPMGSPGMDMGGQKEPYDVLMLMADGTTKVFASYS